MTRPAKPCEVGATVTVRSPHTGEVAQMTVTEVRWDKWLFGGSFRVFGRVAGEEHDRLYYSARDVIAGTAVTTEVDTPTVSDMPQDQALWMLKKYAEEAQEIERLTAQWAATAREAGASWQQIGEALGVSRQAAQQRFGRNVS